MLAPDNDTIPMTLTAATPSIRNALPVIVENHDSANALAAAAHGRQDSASDSGTAFKPARAGGSTLRARWARMIDTKKVIHPPALRFSEEWTEAAEAICRNWVDSKLLRDQSRVSHIALAKMKALEYERKHRQQIAPEQRLLPLAVSKMNYYNAEVDAFLEAIGETDARAVLDSFKLAGTGGLHRQNTTLMATVTNSIGAAQLLVPEPVAKVGLAGARLVMQGVTSGTVVQAGSRRLRNAGTEDMLPLGRADAAPAAKVAPNVLQASSRIIHGLRGADKNLRKMQTAMHDLALLQSVSEPDPQAMQAAKARLELAFAKICHQLSLKFSYKAASENAKIEFRGNQRYLLSSYAGTSATFAAGLIAIMTPALIAAPITGGLSVAAVALAVGLYVGYQLSSGPAKDGEAKAKRAIVALVKLVEVLSGEQTADMQQRAQVWQAYLDARRQVRFASPVRRKAVKRAAKARLLEQLEKMTNDDRPQALLTMQRNWTAYRNLSDAKEVIVIRAGKGVISEAQCRQKIIALEEQFRLDHAADFALDDIVSAWKTPMSMRMVAAQRLLKGRVARLQTKLILHRQRPSKKARWGTQTQKEKIAKKNELRKGQLRQSLCDLFNLELALKDLSCPSGVRPAEANIQRASQRIAAIADEDVRSLFCGDSKAQVDAVDTSKRLAAGEAQRYTYVNAGAAALGITVNFGISIADIVILQEKAAGTYGGPHYNDYKFLMLSQGQAQPAAHLAVGDRAAFQHREMRPLLAGIDHFEAPYERCLQLAGDHDRILRLDDSDVYTALDNLVDQLAEATAVPQAIRLSFGVQPTATANPAPPTDPAPPAATDPSGKTTSELHGAAVELRSTTHFHKVHLKQNSLRKNAAFAAGQIAIGSRQALMSIAGLPTQALAQHRLKKTRAPLNAAADGSVEVRALLQSVALRQRGAKECNPTEAPPQVARSQSVGADIAGQSGVLWRRLQCAEDTRWSGAAPPGDLGADVVPPNATGLRCRDNAHVLKVQGRPIHAHRIASLQTPAATARTQPLSTYAAGQSPDAKRLDDFLLQGIASRQGIFQFVSRRAHHTPERSAETPIIALLQQRRREQPAALLGDRYRIDDLVSIEEKDAQLSSDHVHFMLHVTDTKSGQQPAPVIRIPITQAGLQFTDRVLDAAHIARANALMDAHIDQSMNAANVDATAAATDATSAANASAQPGIDRMVLSRVGIGRNATLITYRTLLARITQPDYPEPLTEATLDDALFDVIYAGRGDRDARYIPSLPQLTALREALLLRIVAQRAAASLPQ